MKKQEDDMCYYPDKYESQQIHHYDRWSIIRLNGGAPVSVVLNDKDKWLGKGEDVEKECSDEIKL